LFKFFAAFRRLLERKTIQSRPVSDYLHIAAKVAEEIVDPAERAVLLRIAQIASFTAVV